MPAEQTQAEIDAHLDRLHKEYGSPIDPQALRDEGLGRGINADALFQNGFPDRAEAEGMKSQQLINDADFLMAHSGVEQPPKL